MPGQAGGSGRSAYACRTLADDMTAWLNERYPETVPTHLRAHIGLDAPNQQFDTLVMGRGTYQPAIDLDIASP